MNMDSPCDVLGSAIGGSFDMAGGPKRSEAYRVSAANPFEIRSMSGGGYIRVILSSYWSEESSREFRGQLSDALRRSGTAQRRILIDAREFAVQSQAVTAELRLMIEDPTIPDCRVAVIAKSQIVQLQSRRIGPDHAVFASESEALKWLLSS